MIEGKGHQPEGPQPKKLNPPSGGSLVGLHRNVDGVTVELEALRKEVNGLKGVVRHLLSFTGTPRDEWINTHAPWLKEEE